MERTDHDYDLNISPPEYFKLRVIYHVNKNDKKNPTETKNMPIANTGDGVALNGRASFTLLVLWLRWYAPCYHCAAHSSDLVMTWMAKSKTISVPQVVKSYDCLWRVVKHFEMKWLPKARRNWMNHWQYLKWISWNFFHGVELEWPTLSQPAINSLNFFQLFAIACTVLILKKRAGCSIHCWTHFCSSFNEWFKATVQRYLSAYNGQEYDACLNGILNCHGHCWPNQINGNTAG